MAAYQKWAIMQEGNIFGSVKKQVIFYTFIQPFLMTRNVCNNKND